MQARERLLLRLREHIKSSLSCAEVSSAWQQCLQQLQQETCIGPRLALQPAVAHILGSMAPSTYIVSLHVSQDGSLLYCAALRGQQTAPPVKGKAGKQGGNNFRYSSLTDLQLALAALLQYLLTRSMLVSADIGYACKPALACNLSS